MMTIVEQIRTVTAAARAASDAQGRNRTLALTQRVLFTVEKVARRGGDECVVPFNSMADAVAVCAILRETGYGFEASNETLIPSSWLHWWAYRLRAFELWPSVSVVMVKW